MPIWLRTLAVTINLPFVGSVDYTAHLSHHFLHHFLHPVYFLQLHDGPYMGLKAVTCYATTILNYRRTESSPL